MRAIVTFHSVDKSGSVISFDPEAFRDFADALERSSVPVCDLDALLEDDKRPGIALTFDDGMESVFTEALPVLRDHGFAAHLFLTVGKVGGDNRWPGQWSGVPEFSMLTWPQIESCHQAGIRIDSHTLSHPDLCQLEACRIEDEVSGADDEIEKRLGRRPRFFAYPYGSNNRTVREQIRERYRGAVTTILRELSSGEDLIALPRLDSYYLRPPWVYQSLTSTRARAYLGLRGLVRRLRAGG